jgi:hypothetical protein
MIRLPMKYQVVGVVAALGMSLSLSLHDANVDALVLSKASYTPPVTRKIYNGSGKQVIYYGARNEALKLPRI